MFLSLIQRLGVLLTNPWESAEQSMRTTFAKVQSISMIVVNSQCMTLQSDTRYLYAAQSRQLRIIGNELLSTRIIDQDHGSFLLTRICARFWGPSFELIPVS